MSGPDRILVVEDDGETRQLLRQYLEENGCSVEGVGEGTAMWRVLEEGAGVDVIILDLMLPGEDGLTLCKRLSVDPRTAAIPVIMLTARGGEIDRVVGLEMGADDYLAKPFSPRELLARIRGVLRRTRAMPPERGQRPVRQYRFAGWTLELEAQRLISPVGVDVTLTRGELTMLVTFLRHPGRILDRDQLMDAYHNREATPFDRGIDVQVGRLRKKLGDDPRTPRIIRTVWGKGYILDGPVEEQ